MKTDIANNILQTKLCCFTMSVATIITFSYDLDNSKLTSEKNSIVPDKQIAGLFLYIIIIIYYPYYVDKNYSRPYTLAVGTT